MKDSHLEISAELIESTFSQNEGAHRFVSFCNAVIAAENVGSPLPILSEKPGADGGIDAEWEIDLSAAAGFKNPFAKVGWNVFQFKCRGIIAGGREKTISHFTSSLTGALGKLVESLNPIKTPATYVLFTNLQLGLKTVSTTRSGGVLSKNRTKIEAAIRKCSHLSTEIQIVDAAQLAALVNKHPAIRLTFFDRIAHTWEEKWAEEQKTKTYRVSAPPLIGRLQELEQLRAWVSDPTIKVIAICGPSGMGKTRLAMECTREHHSRTAVVDLVERFENKGLEQFASSQHQWIVIVEDPTETQAACLAKQAIASNGIKIILTFPSEAKTPQLKLTKHESVKPITLEPLNRDASKELLKSVGSTFDSRALEWVVLHAGGIPEILLAAAEHGMTLREKSGDLKKQLSRLYRGRIEKELGQEAIRALRLVSLLHWVKTTGVDSELPVILGTMGTFLTKEAVLNHIKHLEYMGYVRQRGDYASVVPPLFAATLAEELYNESPTEICDVFDRLDYSSRNRLLERAVTTDASEDAELWNHIFERYFSSVGRSLKNLHILSYLARAVPKRTAKHINRWIVEISVAFGTNDYDLNRSTFVGVICELAYESESASIGLTLLQQMALTEAKNETGSATNLFLEYFVHWDTRVPLSFHERELRIRQCSL